MLRQTLSEAGSGNFTMVSPGQAVRHTHGLAIKQKRSQLTYAALINAGFLMLEEHDLQDIPVAELARKAGYSVGAFYARFRSKDEFFDALVTAHLDFRTNVLKDIYITQPLAKLPNVLIKNVVQYYWEHRKFWRAVIARSLRDPASWAIMRKHRQSSIQLFMDAVSMHLERPLTAAEKSNFTSAFQVTLGTVDITVVNEPGPLFMGQKKYIDELIRAFRLVAGYDALL